MAGTEGNTGVAPDWRTLPAGSALDAIVAERIMGLVPGRDFGAWPEHQWKRNADGTVDDCAVMGDYHNGPDCLRCGHTYCIHCHPNGDGEPCEQEPPGYSGSIGLAWRVVQAMHDRIAAHTYGRSPEPWPHANYLTLSVTGALGGTAASFHCVVDDNEWYERPEQYGGASADTAPLAICRAALAACEAAP